VQGAVVVVVGHGLLLNFQVLTLEQRAPALL
jgi:hypothetical protein